MYVPELALVRFVVEDHDSASDNEFVAQYTLPLSSLQMGKSVSGGGAQTRLCLHASEKGVCWNRRPASASTQRLLRLLHFSTLLCSHAGYRHVPLLDKNGNLLPSAGLFVHIMVLDAE